jgi:hypothetical protein
MRNRTDRLFVTTLDPREREALRLIEQQPGISIAELADAFAVGMPRVWQIVGRLEAGRMRRESGRGRGLSSLDRLS